MTTNTKRGGEPDAARLLELARHELLTHILPQLGGETRYRARLIANALKLAAAELETDPAAAAAEAAALAALTPAGSGSGEGGTDLAAALRSGALDGSAEFHALLVRLTDRRRAALGQDPG